MKDWVILGGLGVALVALLCLNRKVNTIMSTSEELLAKLNSANTRLTNVAGDVTRIKEQLEAAQSDDENVAAALEIATDLDNRLSALDDLTPEEGGGEEPTDPEQPTVE